MPGVHEVSAVHAEGGSPSLVRLSGPCALAQAGSVLAELPRSDGSLLRLPVIWYVENMAPLWGER